MNDNSDWSDNSDVEFREIQDEEVSSDKITNNAKNIFDDMRSLRRLKHSVSKLESCMGSYTLTCSQSPIFNVPCCLTTSNDDTLSDVDLDKFERDNDTERTQFCNRRIDGATSLSDFHNVEVIHKIRIRLETFLKDNQENSVDQMTDSNNKHTLEENITALKMELESYLKAMDVKKEEELRQFSENMINEKRLSMVSNKIM